MALSLLFCNAQKIITINATIRLTDPPHAAGLPSPPVGGTRYAKSTPRRIAGDKANVMDLESYETFDLDIPPELRDQCKEGLNVLYWQILSDRVMKQVK